MEEGFAVVCLDYAPRKQPNISDFKLVYLTKIEDDTRLRFTYIDGCNVDVEISEIKTWNVRTVEAMLMKKSMFYSVVTAQFPQLRAVLQLQDSQVPRSSSPTTDFFV